MRTAPERTLLRRTLVRHATVTIIVAVLVSALITAGAALSAQRETYLHADRVARQIGAAVIVPLSHHDFAHRVDAADRDDLARDLAPFLSSGMVVRIKVWTVSGTHGRIAYSDEPRLEGEIDRTTGTDAARRLDAGEVLVNRVPHDAEHRFETPTADGLLEAFVPFRDTTGTSSRLEVYVPVDEKAATWRSAAAMLPIVLGGLLLVAIAMVPLSVALARRIEHERAEQRAVRRYGLAAAETSRLELARRLHDDVIPDLAGAGLLLDAVRDEESGAGSSSSRTLLDHAHALLTGEVTELRALLDGLVPPDPVRNDLGDALQDLVTRMRASIPGAEATAVTVDASSCGAVDTSTKVLLHRIAGELLRNTFRHAHAGSVQVVVTSTVRRVTLVVTDDGVGFDPAAAGKDGHVGLLLVRRAADDNGGHLAVRSAPGSPTSVTVSLPQRATE